MHRATGSATPLCGIIADDLTGAADAAVAFAVCGPRTRVLLNSDDTAGAEVFAVVTDTRDRTVKDIQERVTHAARFVLSRAPELYFKKIDSTLRGKVGLELAL